MSINFDRLIKHSKKLYNRPTNKNKHFSFLMRKGRVIAIGWNDKYKTNPLAVKYNYPYYYRHSELHALSSVISRTDIHRCILINIRLNKYGELMIAKPCEHCMGLINAFNIKETYYSTQEGFKKL